MIFKEIEINGKIVKVGSDGSTPGINQYKNRDTYYIYVNKREIRVARLVAHAFLSEEVSLEPEILEKGKRHKIRIIHINGNTYDNRAENLKLANYKEVLTHNRTDDDKLCIIDPKTKKIECELFFEEAVRYLNTSEGSLTQQMKGQSRHCANKIVIRKREYSVDELNKRIEVYNSGKKSHMNEKVYIVDADKKVKCTQYSTLNSLFGSICMAFEGKRLTVKGYIVMSEEKYKDEDKRNELINKVFDSFSNPKSRRGVKTSLKKFSDFPKLEEFEDVE